MPKNIVICCDGTGEQFGDRNSNVVKLYSALDNSDRQLTYYHPGLGTIGSRFAVTAVGRWISRLLGLAFGFGLMDNIADAYVFLMNVFEEGDRIFLFGFSRGAYTVRALAALLHMFGLIRKGNEVLVPYAIRRFKSRIRNHHSFEVASGFNRTFSRECKPFFIGVWDTVSSVGWIYDPLHLPFTAHNPDLQILRHAISIDERRSYFRENLWSPLPGQNSKQVWFAGTHCDVGGSIGEGGSGLADIALRWIFDEATHAGLQVLRIPSGTGDPCSPIHPSLTFWWIPIELLPKRYIDTRSDRPRVHWRIPMGRRRWMAEGSLIHGSVKIRMEATGYHPSNLPKDYAVEQPPLPQTRAVGEGKLA